MLGELLCAILTHPYYVDNLLVYPGILWYLCALSSTKTLSSTLQEVGKTNAKLGKLFGGEGIFVLCNYEALYTCKKPLKK